MNENVKPPIIDHSHHKPSVFRPESLLESSRRQKGLPPCLAPQGCLLDFDGEILDHLDGAGKVEPEPNWPCFHTRLYRWSAESGEYGIIGGTVGASFAVLIAEQLFASGCRALVSIGSAGLISTELRPPVFLLIERALRDEGTSYHYLPPSLFADADELALGDVLSRLERTGVSVVRAATWTTDAPYRETAEAIERCRRLGIAAVEMEAAALLAFAAASGRRVACLSHVTNEMALGDNDFDKGGAQGQETAIRLCEETLAALLSV